MAKQGELMWRTLFVNTDAKDVPNRVQTCLSNLITPAFSPLDVKQLGMPRYRPLCNRSISGSVNYPMSIKAAVKPVVGKTRFAIVKHSVAHLLMKLCSARRAFVSETVDSLVNTWFYFPRNS